MVTIKMDRHDKLFKLCVGMFSFDSLSLSMVTYSMCRVAWEAEKGHVNVNGKQPQSKTKYKLIFYWYTCKCVRQSLPELHKQTRYATICHVQLEKLKGNGI